MLMKISDVKFDCKYFKGSTPCLPNKLRGKVCQCDEYSRVSKRILIIKLAAQGDVIRTTPLVVKYRELYPDCHITWVTNSKEILPQDVIDEIYVLDTISWEIIVNQKFDIAINLDKDKEACILLKKVKSEKKFGFIWNKKENHIDAATSKAGQKIITGIFDKYSKENKKSYSEEIFEICGLKFNKEPYLLNVDNGLFVKWNFLRQMAGDKKIIGLNTGCGKRWLTRLWPGEHWIELIKKLQSAPVYPVLLGGPEEDAQNKKYAKSTGAYYPGTFSISEFIAITANTDVVVTAVSMMMHIAIGLKKNLVLLNNIFNKNEFELYGRGKIIEPSTGCDDYYGNKCTRERHCMKDISVEHVFSAIMSYV
jgi:ADP-heptose:LPS heptosyltransferase